MHPISDYERELMRILWECSDSALYAEIAAGLAEKGLTWTKNTIITLLSRLVDKGFVEASKVGRRNRYTALVSEQDYQSEQAERFLKKIYAGDAKGLVSTLIQRELLTAEDYDELREYWEKESGQL